MQIKVLLLSIFITMLSAAYVRGYYEESYTTYNENTPAEQDDTGWAQLKVDKPRLYNILIFLNPKPLNNVAGNILTLLFAIGTLGASIAFEGTKALMILLSVYCWGRIISIFVIMNLVGRGILSPR